MATSYPSGLDALNNPTATDYLDTGTVLHGDQHTNANDAIEAIQAELGTNPKGNAASVKSRLDIIETPTIGLALATTGTINLDMAVVNNTLQWVTLTGNPTFTTSNRVAGRSVTVKLEAGASPRTITWPAWIPLGAALPTTLASGKHAVFTVTFFDTTDAEACASYAAQP